MSDYMENAVQFEGKRKMCHGCKHMVDLSFAGHDYINHLVNNFGSTTFIIYICPNCGSLIGVRAK